MSCMLENNGEMNSELYPSAVGNPSTNCSDIGIEDVNNLRLVNDHDRFIIVIVISCFLCIPVCLVGIVGNIVNIVVFSRQGFADSINISLLCLSIADLGSLITLLWRNILYIPQIGESDLPLDPISFIYLTGGTPHVVLVRISGCITVFIAIERCIAIALPLKVRRIVTHSRTIMANVLIYLFTIAAAVPIFYSNRIAWTFFPDRNRTLLGLKFIDGYQQIEKASFIFNGLVIPFAILFLEITCASIMVAKLKGQAKWRREKAMSANVAVEDTGKKDVRIVKMVLTVTVIFIICSLPINVNYIWMLIDPDVNVKGKYANTMLVSASFAFLCEAINSSLNHFVYLRMSSKFRETYIETCFLCTKLGDLMKWDNKTARVT